MTETPSRRFQGHLIRLGALYLVLSVIPALAGAFDLTVVPEYAIATHVVTLMMGVLFVALGLAWHEFDCETIRSTHADLWAVLTGLLFLVTVWMLFGPLGAVVFLILFLLLILSLAWGWFDVGTIGLEHISYIALVLGGLTVFATGTITALMGVGGDTLSAFDPAAEGATSIEERVDWLAGFAGILFVLGLSFLGIRLVALSDVERKRLEFMGDLRSSIWSPVKKGWKLLWLHLKPLPSSTDRAFFRIGIAMMIAGVLALTIQGLRGWRFISVAGYATVGITALVFMALGLVWPWLVSAAEFGLRDELVAIGFEKGRASRAAKAARRKAVEDATKRPEFASVREAVWKSLREFEKCSVNPDDLRGPKVTEALDVLAKSVLEWKEKTQLTYPTLSAGAVLNGAAVLLAAQSGLHDDPLAVVPAGVTSLLADCVGPSGACGRPFWVKALATIALAFNSIGIITFAHAVYDSSSRPSVPGTMRQKLADRLIRFGVFALAVGFLSAWLPEFSRVPRVGVGTYATLLIIGPMFICFGLVWQPARQKQKAIERVRLSRKKQRATVTALIFGTFLLVTTGMVLALLGIGGTTLSISAQGAVGSDLEELVGKIFVDAAILLVALGMILFWIGVRPLRRTLRNRIVWATTVVAFAVILQAAFYHMYVNYRLSGRYPIHLPDYSYDPATPRLSFLELLLSEAEVEADRPDPVDWRAAPICDEPAGRAQSDCETAQNWTGDDRQWFYHASQGSAFEVPIPYDWIMALEQPTVPFWPRRKVGLLMDPTYLQRFGFLPDPLTRYRPDSLSVNQGYIARYLDSLAEHGNDGAEGYRKANVAVNNPDALPVGFARTESWVDQSNGQMLEVVGFTCAACHTSQIDYRVWVEGDTVEIEGDTVEVEGDTVEVGRDSIARLRIEGGPANIDLGKFRRAVGVSLYLTQFVPGRFDRFADRLEDEARDQRRGLREKADSLEEISDSLAREAADRPMTREIRETRDSLNLKLDSLNLKLDSLGAEIDNPVKRRRLREDFDSLVQRMRDVRTLQRELALYPTEEGFGRLDAFGRIFNFVFGSDLTNEDNLGVADAPVNFPHLWDASRFDWVQYTGSFHQPMIRNAGQSMGVFASLDLKGAGASLAVEKDPTLFTSSINVLNVHEMELLLAGCTLRAPRPDGLGPGCRDERFKGLESPRWPDSIFGPIDRQKAAAGKSLYMDRCAGCHLSPPEDRLPPLPDPDPSWITLARDSTAWTPADQYGNRFLKLNVIPLDVIGTDPRTAINFARRHVDLGELGQRLGLPEDTMQSAYVEQVAGVIQLADSIRVADTLPVRIDSVLDVDLDDLGDHLEMGRDSIQAAEALAILIDSVLTRRYRHYGIRDTLLSNILNGHRQPGYRIELGYRARPLNGIWATAPYLHNGSVPTLFHLLSPQSERPSRFFLGSRMFDRDWVGFDYRTDDPGYFEFDTSLPGNSNRGHSFEGTRKDWVGRPGVLGPRLAVDERLQIIEYLKYMGPLPVRLDSTAWEGS